MTKCRVLAAMLAGAGLSGCALDREQPLMFVQADSLGLTAAAGQSAQGAHVNLGYKGVNFALVPVSVRDADGRVVKLGAERSGSGACSGAGTTRDPKVCDFDAFSVFGHFGANEVLTGTQPQATLGMQKFFATGIAAEKLAEGFSKKVGGGN